MPTRSAFYPLTVHKWQPLLSFNDIVDNFNNPTNVRCLLFQVQLLHE